MSEWRWQWRIEVRLDRVHVPTGTSLRHTIWVDTAAELHERLARWRRDPAVAAYPYRRVLSWVGSPSASCPAGHPWRPQRSGTPTEWVTCASDDCGGHLVLRCADPACEGLVQLDPAPTPGCSPRGR